MFDVSWTDPARETVGQRKHRKEQDANAATRAPSIRSSQSARSSKSQSRSSLFSFFGSNRKDGLTRTGSHSKIIHLKHEDNDKASRRMSSYTVSSEPIADETSGSSTRIPINGYFAGQSCGTDSRSTSSYGTITALYNFYQSADISFKHQSLCFPDGRGARQLRSLPWAPL